MGQQLRLRCHEASPKVLCGQVEQRRQMMKTRTSGQQITDEYIAATLTDAESLSPADLVPLSAIEELNDRLERIQLQLNGIYQTVHQQQIA
jgi:hypothetical protein